MDLIRWHRTSIYTRIYYKIETAAIEMVRECYCKTNRICGRNTRTRIALGIADIIFLSDFFLSVRGVWLVFGLWKSHIESPVDLWESTQLRSDSYSYPD